MIDKKAAAKNRIWLAFSSLKGKDFNFSWIAISGFFLHFLIIKTISCPIPAKIIARKNKPRAAKTSPLGPAIDSSLSGLKEKLTPAVGEAVRLASRRIIEIIQRIANIMYRLRLVMTANSKIRRRG